METTIIINTDSITPDFIEGIKKFFPHKTVEITIQPADETDNILNSPVFTKALEDRIAEYESRKQVISINANDLL